MYCNELTQIISIDLHLSLCSCRHDVVKNENNAGKEGGSLEYTLPAHLQQKVNISKTRLLLTTMHIFIDCNNSIYPLYIFCSRDIAKMWIYRFYNFGFLRNGQSQSFHILRGERSGFKTPRSINNSISPKSGYIDLLH